MRPRAEPTPTHARARGRRFRDAHEDARHAWRSTRTCTPHHARVHSHTHTHTHPLTHTFPHTRKPAHVRVQGRPGRTRALVAQAAAAVAARTRCPGSPSAPRGPPPPPPLNARRRRPSRRPPPPPQAPLATPQHQRQQQHHQQQQERRAPPPCSQSCPCCCTARR